jgi:flagellar biosynthesis/type III secretory pathway protein FliH
MARLLRAVDLAADAIVVPAPGEIDPRFSDALRAAYEQGHGDGFDQGRQVGRAEIETIVPDVAARFERAAVAYETACANARTALRDQLHGLAVEMASAAIGHTPRRDTMGLIRRVTDAIELIDDGPLVISVRREALAEVQAVIDAGGLSVTLRGDDSLNWGEARIEGQWASADLTWRSLVDAASARLAEIDDDMRRFGAPDGVSER